MRAAERVAAPGATSPTAIAEVGCEGREAWNAFVAANPRGHFMQTYEWGQARSAAGWRPIRLALFRDGSIEAAAQIFEKRLPVCGLAVHYVPRGPVVDFSDGQAVDTMLDALRRNGLRRRAVMVRIDLPLAAADPQVSTVLRRCDFRTAERGTYWAAARHVFRLDLSPSEDDLLNSFRKTTRYEIRRAQREGIEVDPDGTPEDLDAFYHLMAEVGARKGFPVRRYADYQALYNEFVPRGLAKLFVARYKGAVIAGAFMVTFGRESWWLHGASDAEHRKLAPSKSLVWSMVTWSKRAGRCRLDLLGSRQPGVAEFKQGFRPQEISFPPCLDLPLSPAAYSAWRLFESQGVPAAVATYGFARPLVSRLRKGR